jgi:uncharacterized protein YbjT (DUF2867 family)
MRVGVTGSTGLIGTALCTALTKRGDDVVRFVRPSSTAVSGTTVRWDPTTGSVNETDLTAVGSTASFISPVRASLIAAGRPRTVPAS